MKHELRSYQKNIAAKGLEILKKYSFLYLAMEVRTGKSLTALEIAKRNQSAKVLFITKIKAFSSIQRDYDNFGYTFDLKIINKESIHKIECNDFNLIICDEAHGLFGTFPKPNNFTKIYKKRFSNIPCILLSGTMSPESYSQLFHQFWINKYAAFSSYKNFYKWAAEFVNVKIKYLGYAQVKDYTDADYSKIMTILDKYIITFTQSQSGFETIVKENFIEVEMKSITYKICNALKTDNVFQGNNDLIIADTGAKLMSKLHQLYSGTIITEAGQSIIIDNSKAVAIQERFINNRIGIFYKFKAELDLLKQTFGDTLTTDLVDFDNGKQNIALQYVSGREGISLKNADYLVFFNPDFSAVSYFQAKDRMTTKERMSNELFWIFSKGGIESKIYKAISSKKNYTLNTFRKDYGIKKD